MTVTVNRELVSHARDAGLNMGATLTIALNAESKKHAATCQHEENAEAIAALNQLTDETECFSDEYWSFQRCDLRYTAIMAGASRFPLLLVLPATSSARLVTVSLFHQYLFERFSRIHPPERLNPILLLVDDKGYALMTHETTTVPVNALGTRFYDVSAHRTLIKGALGFMLDGI